MRSKPGGSARWSHIAEGMTGPVLTSELPSCGTAGLSEGMVSAVTAAVVQTLPCLGERGMWSRCCAGMTVPVPSSSLDMVPTPPILPPRNILMALPSSETKDTSSLPENSRVADVNKLSLSETLLQRLQYQDTSRWGWQVTSSRISLQSSSALSGVSNRSPAVPKIQPNYFSFTVMNREQTEIYGVLATPYGQAVI